MLPMNPGKFAALMLKPISRFVFPVGVGLPEWLELLWQVRQFMCGLCLPWAPAFVANG